MNSPMNHIPDGIYTVRIEALSMKKSKKGDPMLEWHLAVHGGEHDGISFTKRSVLSTPKSKQFTAGEFQKLGKKVGNSDDLRNCRNEIEGIDVKLAVVTDENGKVSYFVMGLAGSETSPTAEEDDGDAWNMVW